MKKLLTLSLILISLSAISQKKDSTDVITDSTSVITWADLQFTLQSFYGKIDKEKYEQAQTFYQILWNNAINRKKKKK